MVILVHTSQSIPNLPELAQVLSQLGQTGVQLFFIASAYTLCATVESRRHEPHSVASFYVRRYFRIEPLYYLGIIFYFCLHILLQHGAKFRNDLLSSIGKVSYSMYVFHFLFAWPVLRFIIKTWTPSSQSVAAVVLVTAFLAVAAITFLVAKLTEKHVERVGIALGARLIKTMSSWRTRLAQPRYLG